MLPLVAFLTSLFFFPVVGMLTSAVDNGVLSKRLTSSNVALAEWDGQSVPPEAAFTALADDFARADAAGEIVSLATEMNNTAAGFRSLVMRTQKALAQGSKADGASFIEIDRRWDDLSYWRALKAASARFTDAHILAVLDLEHRDNGSIALVPEDRRVYVPYLLRTLLVSLSVTVLCLVIGYPIAYAVAHAKGRMARILLLLIMLPFWTSLLVRTAAWVVILQKQGMVNQALMWLGLISEPVQLLFNRAGVLIGMTHVLLPFAILPLYAVMLNINPSQMRAAASLGARPFRSFLTIFLPQTVPGIVAGGLMVFILANGFYITPALLGGAADQLISALIADLAIGRANWAMASALSLMLLLSLALVSLVFNRFARGAGVRV
jgi:putative spermidine/putrescine transport system permease protein